MISILRIKKSDLVTEWKILISNLIELCFEVSKIVSQIVNSSSPEGIFPAELATSKNTKIKLLI